MKNKFIENIDYSETWILREICEIHDEQRKTGKIQYVKMKKIDLLNLVLKFVKLNERGM